MKLLFLINFLFLGLALSQDVVETTVDDTVKPKLTETPETSHVTHHTGNGVAFFPDESPAQKPWKPSPRICLHSAQLCTSSQECCSGLCNIIRSGFSICANGYSPVYNLNGLGLTQSTYGGVFKKGGFKIGGGYKKIGGGFKKGSFIGGKYGKFGSSKFGKFKG